MTLPVIVSDGGHASPPAPREPVPAVGQGIFNITNLLRPDIQDSIRIFPRSAAPSRSAALLLVASQTPLPAAPPLRGLCMTPITARAASSSPISPAFLAQDSLHRGHAPISPKLGRVPVRYKTPLSAAPRLPPDSQTRVSRCRSVCPRALTHVSGTAI